MWHWMTVRKEELDEMVDNRVVLLRNRKSYRRIKKYGSAVMPLFLDDDENKKGRKKCIGEGYIENVEVDGGKVKCIFKLLKVWI